ncbi:MAG: tetratricopeptide repeat protein, partial [Bdellovibrionales bacterium]
MSTFLHQATTLHNQGQLEEAERLYRAVLAEDPRQPDALALLGVLRSQRKDYAEAVAFLNRAVECDPLAALFRFYLGNVYFDMNDLGRAEASFREALARLPSFADAHYRLALVFEKQKNLKKAADHLCEAAEIQPDNGAAWLKLSELSLKIKDYAQALKAAEISVQLMPNDLAAYIAQALALDCLDREEEALAPLQRAVQIKPYFSEAWDMLGSTYQKLGSLGEAESAFRKAIETANGIIEGENDREVAEEEYCVHHWNLALLELLRGDFHHGFAHYRARFKKDGRTPRLPFPQPLWNGEDLAGKKILLVGEQGFGDVLMLCRFAP